VRRKKRADDALRALLAALGRTYSTRCASSRSTGRWAAHS
jgi:hypothetical protein